MRKFFQLKDENNDDIGLLLVRSLSPLEMDEIDEDAVTEIFKEIYHSDEWEDTDQLFDWMDIELVKIGLESDRIFVDNIYA